MRVISELLVLCSHGVAARRLDFGFHRENSIRGLNRTFVSKL
jgi:hypothetical protein